MKKAKVKLIFSFKTDEEVASLTHEELLEYVKNIHKNVVQEKPKKDSSNSSISPSCEIVPPQKN